MTEGVWVRTKLQSPGAFLYHLVRGGHRHYAYRADGELTTGHGCLGARTLSAWYAQRAKNTPKVKCALSARRRVKKRERNARRQPIPTIYRDEID